MSVYFEALQSGRFFPSDCHPIPGKNKGIKRALREAKRYEANERNSRTPYERTKKYRRDLAAIEGEITEKAEQRKAKRKAATN